MLSFELSLFTFTPFRGKLPSFCQTVAQMGGWPMDYGLPGLPVKLKGKSFLNSFCRGLASSFWDCILPFMQESRWCHGRREWASRFWGKNGSFHPSWWVVTLTDIAWNMVDMRTSGMKWPNTFKHWGLRIWSPWCPSRLAPGSNLRKTTFAVFTTKKSIILETLAGLRKAPAPPTKFLIHNRTHGTLSIQQSNKHFPIISFEAALNLRGPCCGMTARLVQY